MNVLVCGARGFVGRAAVYALMANKPVLWA